MNIIRTHIVEDDPVGINLCFSFWIQDHSLIGPEIRVEDFLVVWTGVQVVWNAVTIKIILTDVASTIA